MEWEQIAFMGFMFFVSLKWCLILPTLFSVSATSIFLFSCPRELSEGYLDGSVLEVFCSWIEVGFLSLSVFSEW
jgi:hypothetical protein